ncbi:hypothetical protein RIF29_07848 [Crotalaria pallida]|uniref:At2g35280-like TPR domain-containing protein n=1 Tax=Crotalaria pallida TaxID=3830 RepID=A0AAN9PBK4_CROPI
MATSRLLMKRASNKRGTTISLPKNLITNIVARVASHSLADLVNLKRCCKDFLDAAEDDFAYKHVSLLHKFPLFPWRPLNDKKLSFLKRCKESQNMDTLFREGLLEYLRGEKISGLRILKIVALKGHKEAKYVYGMIMLSSEDEELRKEGLEHMRFLRESKCVIRCRGKVEKLVQYAWKKNILLHNKKTLCHNKSICKGWRPREGRWLLLDDEDDNNDNINMCEYCRWDQELELFNIH